MAAVSSLKNRKYKFENEVITIILYLIYLHELLILFS
jgi:hypothetical protein